jgi:hypothetical protein
LHSRGLFRVLRHSSTSLYLLILLQGEVYHAFASLVARNFSTAHHVVGVVTSINTPYTTSKGGTYTLNSSYSLD